MSHMFRNSSFGTLLHLLFIKGVPLRRPTPSHVAAPGRDDACQTTRGPLADGERAEARSLDLESREEEPIEIPTVEWDGDGDLGNPQNWPVGQKVWITFIINLYTFVVYAGSSIYTSSEDGIKAAFHIGNTEATLGLALYVLGYGSGCLLLSPLTEIPAIGRNPPYAVSGLLLVLLSIPAALVRNYPGLMVLRFLIGLMASPPLATSGASLGDVWDASVFPFVIGVWAMTTALAPALGPTLSSYAVLQLGWRFASWELLIMACPVYLLLITTVPETSGSTILHYRETALRRKQKLGINSKTGKKPAKQTVNAILTEAVIKPWEINIKDPALLFTTLYFGLIYGIYYTFFESLPLVFPACYGFTPESTGLVFLGAVPAGLLAITLHFIYMRRIFRKLREGTFGELENHLIPGVLFSWFIPAGLFLYAWSSRPSIHWIAPALGLAIVMFAMYFVTQSIFAYIPMIYPRYAASIFAASSFARSAIAFAAILVAQPMFDGLGVNGGVSLLAGLTVLCAAGMVVLRKFGKALRERSRFAVD